MTIPPSFGGLSRIGQISIHMVELDRAVAFFKDTEGNTLALMSEVRS